MISITEETIDLNKILSEVTDPSCGGIDFFIGTVRNLNQGKEVTHLFFESYIPMAIKELQKIIDRMYEQWEVKKHVVIHRVGKVGIGEVAVVIAVTTVHRKQAFQACEFVIDELKKTVPIWKKEFYKDGEVWINATP